MNNTMLATGNEKTVKVSDAFAITTYTGTGAARSINVGLDLTDGDCLVWIIARTGGYGNSLYTNLLGASNRLDSASTGAYASQPTSLTAFTTTGFNLGALASVNANGQSFVAYTFKRSKKFFDILLYNGDANSSQNR